MSRPTVRELDTKLKDLIKWGAVATHLPGLSPADIQTIMVNNPLDVQDQKLALFDKWLRQCPEASWDHVIEALESANQTTLADKIKGRGSGVGSGTSTQQSSPGTNSQSATDTYSEQRVGGGACGKQTHQSNPETSSETAIKITTAIDIGKVKKHIIDVLNEKHPTLRTLIDNSIEDFAAKLLARKMLTPQVHKNPSSNSIMESVILGLNILDELEEVEEYCRQFLSAFVETGGPFETMAKKLEKSINKKLQEEMNLTLDI